MNGKNKLGQLRAMFAKANNNKRQIINKIRDHHAKAEKIKFEKERAKLNEKLQREQQQLNREQITLNQKKQLEKIKKARKKIAAANYNKSVAGKTGLFLRKEGHKAYDKAIDYEKQHGAKQKKVLKRIVRGIFK